MKSSTVHSRLLILLALILVFSPVIGQFTPNYDESKIPDYTLPDPLVFENGDPVKTAEEWTNRRRGEVMTLFERHVYGKMPKAPANINFKTLETDKRTLKRKATRKQIQIIVGKGKFRQTLDLLVYLPNQVSGPVPVFLGLNFKGNHTVHADPEIRISSSWVRNDPDNGVVNNRMNEEGRGMRNNRWPVEMILDAGYGVATMYYGDIDPDYDDEFENGVHPIMDKGRKRQTDAWGSIGAWAWGLSRAMDYLATDEQVDNNRVIVLGHSRLGKTSLWAGAADQRFAMVISNDSGCGGAALSRRKIGETVGRINTSFPHWFCENFRQYNDNESALPVDQHELIALAAPRPVLVCSAQEDRWADPKGEFLSCKGASEVYKLLGTDGFAAEDMPEINQLISSRIGYHIRAGGHDVKETDWKAFIAFANKHLPQK